MGTIETINQINKIRFKGLREFECGNALVVPIKNPTKAKASSLLKSLAAIFLKTNYSFSRGTNGVLFVFTSHYSGRKDYQSDYSSVSNSVIDSSKFESNQKKRFSFKKIVGLFRWFGWNKQLKKVISNKSNRYACCNYLLIAYYSLNKIKHFYRKNGLPSLVITFCDVFTTDYLITSFFKQKKVKTATLQHASYCHLNEGSLYYSLSPSDYFLGINEYSLNEAILSGYDKNRFIICGPMKYIDSKPKNENHASHSNRLIIGVALSGGGLGSENLPILSCVTDFVKNHRQCSLVIRPHPTIPISQYSQVLSNIPYEINSGSMSSFIDSCDIFITGNSNVFLDLLGLGKLALRYSGYLDFFESIKAFSFSSSEELSVTIETLLKDSHSFDAEIKKYKQYVAPCGDIKKNYIDTIINLSEV